MNVALRYGVITFLGLFGGVFFFLLQQEIIIIRWAFQGASGEVSSAQKNVVKKKISCFVWKDETFHAESLALIWLHDNEAENVKNVVKNWLSYNQDEIVLPRSLSLDSVVMSAFNEQAFLSFNQLLLASDWSVAKKWHVIESLLKTMKEAGCNLRAVHFFVNHQPMQDNHLDFSQPWSLAGFLS